MKTGKGGTKASDERASELSQTPVTPKPSNFEASPANASHSAGSSSVSTGSNVQSVAVQ